MAVLHFPPGSPLTESDILNVDTSGLVVKGTALKMTKYVGDTYQRKDQQDVRAYMRILVDKGTVNASGKYEFNIAGGFWYNGYLNAVPFEIGCVGIDSNGNDVASIRTVNQDVWLVRQEMFYENNTKIDWWYRGITVTVPIPEGYSIGLMPFVKLGGVKYGSEDFNNGNFWNKFDTQFGVTILNDPISGAAILGTNSFTYSVNGKKADLPCWVMFGGKNNSIERSYSNCPVTVSSSMPIYVYDSARKPQKAKGIWVYDANRRPQPAKSITIYGSGGSKTTITL